MRHAFALSLALVAAVANAAEPPTVLVVGHSPDGVALGGLLTEIAADLERRGIPALDPAEASAKLPAAKSPDALEAAIAAIDEGERAYLDLDLDRAAAQLGGAIEKLDATAGPRSVLELVRALERFALTQLANGDAAEGAATLDRLYRIAPAHKPDPTLVSPRFAPAFDDAAKRQRNAIVRPLRVVSTPEGAEIYVDGRAAGVAPVAMALGDGPHRVEARLAGHWAVVQTSEVASTTSEIAVRLTAASDESDRGAAVRDSLAAGVLPARRERFAAEACPRVGAAAALVITVRRGSAPSADLYRASQPAASLDRVEGGATADAAASVASWVERRLRPPIAATPRTPVTPRSGPPRVSPWIWAAGAAVFAAGAGAAYAGSVSDDETTRVEPGAKTVRFGGGG